MLTNDVIINYEILEELKLKCTAISNIKYQDSNVHTEDVFFHLYHSRKNKDKQIGKKANINSQPLFCSRLYNFHRDLLSAHDFRFSHVSPIIINSNFGPARVFCSPFYPPSQ